MRVSYDSTCSPSTCFYKEIHNILSWYIRIYGIFSALCSHPAAPSSSHQNHIWSTTRWENTGIYWQRMALSGNGRGWNVFHFVITGKSSKAPFYCTCWNTTNVFMCCSTVALSRKCVQKQRSGAPGKRRVRKNCCYGTTSRTQLLWARKHGARGKFKRWEKTIEN